VRQGILKRVEREDGLSCGVYSELSLDKSVVKASVTVHALPALS